MKMFKKKIILILILLVVLMIFIVTLLYANKGILNRRIENNVKLSQEQESNFNANSIDISKWDLDKVNIVYDTNNVPVPVPKGYVASQVNGEYTVNTGFVIYEGEEPVTGLLNEEVGTYSTDSNSAWVASCTRNQWVWVPVPDANRIYERDEVTGKAKSKLYEFTAEGIELYVNRNREPGVLLGISNENERKLPIYSLQGMTKKELLEELEIEFEETIASIEKYGGFYIGRYETGDVSSLEIKNSNCTPRKPVVKRMNENLKHAIWYNAYNDLKNIQINENVKTNMIWGALWDETMQWLIDSESKVYEQMIDSSGWGNYKETEFEYRKTDGSIGNKTYGNYFEMTPTGGTERNKINNIYDMAGNVGEMTLEIFPTNDSCRVKRGGSCNSSIVDRREVVSREMIEPNINGVKTYDMSGVRAYLYIK